MSGSPLLEVKDLTVRFRSGENEVVAVDGLTFRMEDGEALGVVGESGAGKSATALALSGLLPPDPGKVEVWGSIRFRGEEVVGMSPRRLRRLRGRRVAMVFQEPMTALNPVFSVGDQVAEAIRQREGLSKGRARRAAARLLEEVDIPDPEVRCAAYPHQLSGGMRQRVVVAIALACRPDLLVADEPTSALDVTIQAQILELLHGLRRRHGMALLLISHDLGVVAQLCGRVLVMAAGRRVEEGRVERLLSAPEHPYTRRLAAAVSGLEGGCEGRSTFRGRIDGAPHSLLEVREATKYFEGGRSLLGRRRPSVRALESVSFSMERGETLGLVGESGCGKSTLARAILGLETLTSGSVRFDGRELRSLGQRELQRLRRRVQVVFQDPFGSLNPRRTAGAALEEVLKVHRLHPAPGQRRSRTYELLDLVGLSPEHAGRYPHQFSGGQRQRLALARALAVEPELLILDEPVSSLDASVQARILELLAGLQDRLGLTYLFISHDLAVVRRVSDRVAVMYLGRVVEMGAAGRMYEDPRHPYTRALLSALPPPPGIPSRGRLRVVLSGDVPSPTSPPVGCPFHPRCPHPERDEECQAACPPLVPSFDGHRVACFKEVDRGHRA